MASGIYRCNIGDELAELLILCSFLKLYQSSVPPRVTLSRRGAKKLSDNKNGNGFSIRIKLRWILIFMRMTKRGLFQKKYSIVASEYVCE